MIKRIHHIGLAVESMEEARYFFRRHFSVNVSEEESFGDLLFSFIMLEGTKIELLQSIFPGGQIARFIKKRGQGIHHVAFEVDNIEMEMNRLQSRGLRLIHKEPYVNAHGDSVAFIHPKSTFGVLTELIQKTIK